MLTDGAWIAQLKHSLTTAATRDRIPVYFSVQCNLIFRTYMIVQCWKVFLFYGHGGLDSIQDPLDRVHPVPWAHPYVYCMSLTHI